MTRGQFTFYADETDITEWRRLAKPYPLNRWIREIIQRHIEASAGTEHTNHNSEETQIVAALKKKNSELLAECKRLVALTNEKETRVEKPVVLNQPTVDLLKSGNCWSSKQIINKIVAKEDEYSEYFGNLSIIERANAVSQTLELLEECGIIRKNVNGYVWNK